MLSETHGRVPCGHPRMPPAVQTALTTPAGRSRSAITAVRTDVPKTGTSRGTTTITRVPTASRMVAPSSHPRDNIVAAASAAAVVPSSFKPGKLYTTEQVAAVTGLDKKTFEAWRLKGVGGPPFIKFGRAVRYHGDDLLAWIAANRRCSTSEG